MSIIRSIYSDLQALHICQVKYLREKSENKLQHEKSHGDQAQPGVQRVEIWLWWFGQIMRIEDGQETDDDARNGQCMEKGVRQLGIDVLQATAQTIQQNGWA